MGGWASPSRAKRRNPAPCECTPPSAPAPPLAAFPPVAPPTTAPYAILSALPEELAVLDDRATSTTYSQGLEILTLDLGPALALACSGGVGKVNAAHATSTLFSSGATRGLFIVGVCGGLRRSLAPGTLVHCERAIQTDLALRAEREIPPDSALLESWLSTTPGTRAWFLTADRPVLSLWRRLRLARAFAG